MKHVSLTYVSISEVFAGSLLLGRWAHWGPRGREQSGCGAHAHLCRKAQSALNFLMAHSELLVTQAVNSVPVTFFLPVFLPSFFQLTNQHTFPQTQWKTSWWLSSRWVLSDSFATPWTVACQAPLSLRFPRQEYWRRLPFPSSGILPDPGIEPVSPALAGRFFTTKPPGSLLIFKLIFLNSCPHYKMSVAQWDQITCLRTHSRW